MAEPLSVELISLAKKGDPQAIEELVKQFRKPLYRYACSYLGNDFEAEDLTQEVLIKAIRALPTFKGDSSIGTWIFRIMTNSCIDYHRKQTSHPVSYLNKLYGDEEEAFSIDIKDTRPQPSEELEQQELRSFIKKALRQLSPEHRVTVILHDLQGFKYQEIAEITKSSLGTVKSRLFYARQELKRVLGPLLQEEVSSNALPQ